MITFKLEQSVPEELVTGLALKLKWTDVIPTQVLTEDGMSLTEYIDNPETAEEFVAKKIDELMKGFLMPYGNELVAQKLKETGIEEQLQKAKEQIEGQIITPILEGIKTEVVVDNVPLQDEVIVK